MIWRGHCMDIYPLIMSQGELINHKSLHFPIEERGLQFGDGVYEVIRLYNGSFYLLKDHIDRLFRSLEAIKLTIAFSGDELASILKSLVKENKVAKDSIIYLQVTRGSAPRTHFFPEDVEPNMYAYVKPVPRPIDKIKTGVSTITHIDERWKNCHIKSLNLLPNILAKQVAVERGCFEALLYGEEDKLITEGSSSNIYLVKNKTIHTHPESNAILTGCVRNAVKRLAENLNIPFVERAFTTKDLVSADELFLTSSISEVMPIVKVNGIQINDGKRGAISKRLQEAYEEDALITSLKKQ